MAETSSFEDEILALNPEYDLVFSKYNENQRNSSPNALEPYTRWSGPQEMKIISKMNEIINAKPIGELPTQHDWDDQQSTEMETIILMRKMGLEQSVDRPPDEKRTISTVPTSEDVIFMKNGRKKMSIFMGGAYFELKPRSEPSFDFDEDAPPTEESTISEFSDDVNLYQPIIESSHDSVSTSLSEDTEDKYRSRVAYDHLDECSQSPKPKSVESQLKPNMMDCSKKRFNSSRSSSSNSNRSSRSWRSPNTSFSDVRDEKNWRLNVSKDKEPEPQKPKSNENSQQKILNRTFTLSKGTSTHPSNVSDVEGSSRPDEVSSCGRTLYKPKDLFIKKKAMMLKQVFAEYQS